MGGAQREYNRAANNPRSLRIALLTSHGTCSPTCAISHAISHAFSTPARTLHTLCMWALSRRADGEDGLMLHEFLALCTRRARCRYTSATVLLSLLPPKIVTTITTVTTVTTVILMVGTSLISRDIQYT